MIKVEVQMKISHEFLKLIEDRQKEKEKYEIYRHVYKFHESDSEFFYYIVYKYYQEGRGYIILSSSRKLIPKNEAVEIAYYFLTHNGTVSAALGPISEVRKRKVKTVQKIKSKLLEGEDLILTNRHLADSYHMINNTLELQIGNTRKVNDIYNQIKELDLHIQRKTHVLTKEAWQKGRNLIHEYNVTMYEELKTLLKSWESAEKIIDYLNRLNLGFLEKYKARNVVKQLQIMFNEQAKEKVNKSLEDFEKDFQGNFFTNQRGELNTEEYIQVTNRMMEEDYKRNLLRDCRNS